LLVKVREILALCKLATQKSDVERFNLRKLDELKVRNSIRLRSQIFLQLWRTEMIARTYV